MMFFECSSARRLCLFTLIIAASLSFAQSNTLTGSVTYSERIALPSDAVIDLQLIDTSVVDIAARTVAEVLINVEGRQVPVPFTLTYDPVKIVPANRYSVRAIIRSGDGMLMFSTTQSYPVLTHGAPSKVNLLLHTVGHAAHSKAAAKMKELARSPAETAPAAAAESTSSTKITEMTSEKEPAPNAAPSPSEPTTSATPATAPAEQPPVKQDTEPAGPPITPTKSATAPPPPNAAPSQTAPPAAESANQTPAPQSAPPMPEAAPPLPAPDAKAASPEAPSSTSTPAQPETPLPEAPSATKRAELAAAAPESAEPEPESTSRPEKPAPNKGLTPLADTQWKLVQLNGLDVVITSLQKPVTLAFSPEGRRIAGSAGCNSYLGTFTDDHGRLELHPGNMTMMICGDPAGTREKKFVAMLRSADGYKINGDFLILTSNGKTVAKFKNNPPL
jgi:uncharacterized lipoprotein YbaY/heat shock protein HslJ